MFDIDVFQHHTLSLSKIPQKFLESAKFIPGDTSEIDIKKI
jgi:hypothetical protein